MRVLAGTAIVFVGAVGLTLADIMTNNDLVDPWNRKLWSSHFGKCLIYFLAGLAGLFAMGGITQGALALGNLSERVPALHPHGVANGLSLSSGLGAELVCARWTWHRETSR